jgi:hypothetical protein
MLQQTAVSPVVITHPDFAKGYECGRIWYFTGNKERIGDVDDKYLIRCVSMYAEKQYHTPALINELYWHMGFLLAMATGSVIPEE